MSDPVEYLVKAVFGTAGTAAVVGVIIYVVRGAVAKAVQQAGDRELARLNAKLDLQLEDKRQQFTRDLAHERELSEKAAAEAQRAFAREMERYKTELNVGAEARRQIVMRRLDAIDRIYAEALRVLTAVRTGEDLGVGERVDMHNGFNGLLREQSHLLDEKLVADVGWIVTEYIEADKAINEHRGTEKHAKLINDLHVHLAKRMREALDELSRSEG